MYRDVCKKYCWHSTHAIMKEIDRWRIYKEKANAGASNNATTTIWLHTINVESF
jgi:hypothetical protein